jgi:transposase-like protein
VISYAVWPYHRFPLSLRMVEERLAARGLELTYETVRRPVGEQLVGDEHPRRAPVLPEQLAHQAPGR